MGNCFDTNFAKALSEARAQGRRCVIGKINDVGYSNTKELDLNRISFIIQSISHDGVVRNKGELYDYALTHPEKFRVLYTNVG